MRNWQNALAFFLVAAAVTPAAAGEPALTDQRLLFAADDSDWLIPNRRWPLMRLSPDGKHLLYHRPVQEQGKTQYECVVRNIAKGKDTPLTVRPLPKGFESIPIRFEPFDPAGKRIALMEPIAQNKMRFVTCDLMTGKATPTRLAGRMPLGRFMHDGRLIVLTDSGLSWAPVKPGGKPTPIGKGVLQPRDYISSSNPKVSLLCLFTVVKPAAQPADGRRARPSPALVIFDLEQNKIIGRPPVHPLNSALDDIESKWTTDGRYLYYPDLDGEERLPVVRVWDRTARKVATFSGGYPLGPGHTATTMVVETDRKQGTGLLLHDAATGKLWPIADESVNGQTAAAGHVVYRKTTDRGETVHMARIGMPK